MKIAIILKQPYPNGMACTNRVHLYAKGLKKWGNELEILIPRATESNTLFNKDILGIYEEIPFRYFSTSTCRSNNIIKRHFSDIISPIKLALYILKYKPKIILLVSPLFYHAILFKIAAIMCKSKYVLERNEAPFMRQDKLFFIQKKYLKFIYSLFDGIILITHALKDCLKYDVKSKTKVCIIPIIVDFEGKIISKKQVRSNKLVYTGSLLQRKDGILTIIESFQKISLKWPDIKLYISGNMKKSPDFMMVNNFIGAHNLQERIIFTGYLSSNDYKQLMVDADILLLAKPLNRQNYYNFPTKIGDYLSVGVPVLVTNVGAITNYFEDKKNMFFSEPEHFSFAEKIEFILENYDLSCKIAKEGKRVALERFDYIKCTKNLDSFFHDI